VTRRSALVLRVLATCAAIAGIVWLVRDIDARALGAALARARLWPIALAAAINFGIIASKALAWRILFGRDAPGVARLFRYGVIACAASVILPLRSGELLRLWLLRDRDGIALSRGAAVAIAEKLLDVVSLVVLVAPLPLFAPVPPELARWIAVLAGGGLVGVAGVALLAPRIGSTGWRGELAHGLGVLRDRRAFAAATAALVGAWLIDLAMIELVLRAVGLSLPFGGSLIVLFTLNIAIALPSTPGQLGALELGALVGLRLLGAPEAESLAFALLYHVLQLVPVVAIGLLLGADEIWARRIR
jgi:uncharacterized membrane protein YbhN (UPF0104 family)